MTGFQPAFRIDYMNARTWNKPLPDRFLLGGEQRFSSEHQQSNQGWVLRQSKDTFPAPVVELLQDFPGINFRIYPRIYEPTLTEVDPLNNDPTPLINSFSWDWIEFVYQPIKELEVRSIYWSPDSAVICGESWVANHSDQEKVVFLDLVCLLQFQGAGNLIAHEEIGGRPVLTGCLGDQYLILFLAGNPILQEGPFPYLQNKLSIAPDNEERIQWFCIRSDTHQSALEVFTNVLQLDWSGEISRRKVALQSQVEITTGDPDWDFVLAHSQKQSLWRYHQIASRKKLESLGGGDLSPTQALMLLQSLDSQGSDSVKNILDLVFNQPGQPDPPKKDTYHDQTPPILAGELLWQVHRMGFSIDNWPSYLERTAGWLADWFSPQMDKDSDGIPELLHPQILDLAGSRTAADKGSKNRFFPSPYLESPGLGALIYNDLCKIEDLLLLAGEISEHNVNLRKKNLLNFLQSSWDSKNSKFQNRDSHSHEAVVGFDIFKNLQPGLNILRKIFPQPARIAVMHLGSAADHPRREFRIICHGLDFLGNYRIEELHSPNSSSHDGINWIFSESIFSNLDYCLLKDRGLKGQINLVAPSTFSEDITMTLPLWAGILPDHQTREIFENVLLDPNRYWSPYGFSSQPGSKEATMDLFWNLLLGQALLKLGKMDTAAKMIERWMDVIIPALGRSGSTYPSYEISTGQGLGLKDSLESLFPIRFFLQVLGIEILQNEVLSIEGKNPFPWPVKLRYRGMEIRRDKRQTTIIRPGKDTLTLTDLEKIQIKLD